MKTDFSVNIQVNIGVTPEVVQLVTAILTKKPATVLIPEAKSDEPQPEPQAEAPKKPRKGKGEAAPEAPKEPEAEQQAAETSDDQPEPQAAEAPADDAPRELTEEDVREAMHRTRQRIEGENYKENTDSENYKKYHRALTQTFKNIAALLGSDKPSTLPADKREAFISEVNDLIINEKGEISKTPPF